ncbi:MAG TPA: hypothetical protein VGN91_29450 [Bosea sp. (in: a-proteobacteria)]|jgi:hypothetical protein|nr:hypothetical protein [Bosea sp. (in: a-proteobacteria)]
MAMAELPKLDLEVVDIRHSNVPVDDVGEVVVTMEVVGGQVIDLHLGPLALSKLEAFLARANQVRAKRAPIQ